MSFSSLLQKTKDLNMETASRVERKTKLTTETKYDKK